MWVEKMTRKERDEHKREVQVQREASWPSAIEAGEYALGVNEEDQGVEAGGPDDHHAVHGRWAVQHSGLRS